MKAVVHLECHHPVSRKLLPVGYEFDGSDPSKGSDDELRPLLDDPMYEPCIAVTSREPAAAPAVPAPQPAPQPTPKSSPAGEKE